MLSLLMCKCLCKLDDSHPFCKCLVTLASGESSLAEAGLGFGEYSSNEGDFFSEDCLSPIIWDTKISGLSIGR